MKHSLICGLFLMTTLSIFASSNVVHAYIAHTIAEKLDALKLASHNDSAISRSAKQIIFRKKRRFALVLFYESSCPHCQYFSPIVKKFASQYGFKVYAYSADGKRLPSFPNTMPITQPVEQEFFHDHSDEVPTLFLVNVNTLQHYLITQGAISYLHLLTKTRFILNTVNNHGVN